MLNKAITTIIRSEYCDHLVIHVHRKQTYVTNYTHLSVCCYTLEGKMLWQVVLVKKIGITVYNNFYIYVASNTYSCVIVLSPERKKMKQITSSDDGLHHPRALHFDDIRKSLFVANANLPIYHYMIT